MSLIKKPFELKVQTSVKVLIYGQPGIGKTSLALSSPAPLLLDFDGGVHRVNPKHQTDTVQIESWGDVLQLLDGEDLTAYRTLITDTAGKMLDFMTMYLIKSDPKLGRKDGALTQQGYGARKAMFNNFLKKVSLLGKHLIFIAHEKEEKEGDQKIIRPEIGGSSGNDLIKELDLVGYMEAIGKMRTISFDPCEKFYGKNTCNLPPLIELPDIVSKGEPNNRLIKIFDDYQNSLEERKRMGDEYNTLIELITGRIKEVVDAETANGFIEWIKPLQHIWDSQFQGSLLLKDKAKELNLEFDKTLKKYKNPKSENVETQQLALT